MSKSQIIKIALSAALSGLALTAGAGNAHATASSTSGCTVYDVGADTNATKLTLHCVGDSHHYSTNYTTCPAVNTEQVKMWESMMMAALLSGKKLNIWWDDTCSAASGNANHRAIMGLFVTTQ